VEAFHRVLKYFYFKGKVIKRLVKSIVNINEISQRGVCKINQMGIKKKIVIEFMK